ncbi:nuclear receptor 2C2-associated protein [Drosophila tropicalis]|uniref:F5/8 type C domain-containing protein n=1 Tax=Drosophila willistoni TaxID=7260 RepID=A0A0Q9WPM7_DROWI|nr:nuclear receptor 2C2-associated protein [Drosophila willistoni]KRF98127.1 uncharacterized protein Dwil_GK28053 [Drosophila willistoni]
MNVLRNTNYSCRVSSVLNKDVKQYGKQYMFDDNEDTSWSSDEGSSQWICLTLDEPQTINGFCIQFQGGFAGQKSNITIYSQDGNVVHQDAFYPEDINSSQYFKLQDLICHKIKFVFESTTDFFGRIIVYKLQLLN